MSWILIVVVAAGIVMSALVLMQIGTLKSRVTTVEAARETSTSSLANLVLGIRDDVTTAKAGSTYLSDAMHGIRDDLSTARAGLVQVQTYAVARQEMERRTSESIRRLELVIAGTYSKGAGGENLLDAVLAQLPQEWQVRDLRVAGKPVEFGLRLPNNLILPIDSKWPATALLEQFASSEDGARNQLRLQITQEVLSRGKEVQKYIDPSRTASFAVMAVPDSVYEVAHGAQVEMVKLNVVLITYSMLLPYLLLVYHTVGQASRDIDIEKLGTYMQAAEGALRTLQDELDGRFARALTMLTNSRNDTSVLLGRLHIGLANMMISAGAKTDPSELSATLLADAQRAQSNGAAQDLSNAL